jgi:hypothetical protein
MLAVRSVSWRTTTRPEARHIAEHVATILLKTMFEIIATMADDPAKYRSE